ncbi:MAG TPA: 50S ribosomal protein L4 [Patescibacteria group bacterium]|nr:50S ribosomal protein L4 [Patescibacteria group bacterium]
MAVSAFTKTGTKATTTPKLDKSVFSDEASNHELLKGAYHAYLANSRQNLAVTKTRGLVRGGGRKPWKQKGTGRARTGSSRNPLWRGGGITFGPTGLENYSIKINPKAKRKAIRQALSLANIDNKLIVIDQIELKQAKTKDLASLLTKVGANRNTLLVIEKSTKLLQAAQNIPNLILVSPKYLSVFRILNSDKIIFTSDSLKVSTDWLKKDEK